MRKTAYIIAACLFCACGAPQEKSLKETFAEDFYIGTALNEAQITGIDTKGVETVKKHFNSIVAENCMKSEEIHPEEGVYDFTLADQFVKFGEDNGMFIIGHCLIWHSQLAKWFPYDENGNYVTPEVLKERMKEHITTIVSRYKGRIHGWDVVNEAIIEDGSYRKSPFYEILGEEFECAAVEGIENGATVDVSFGFSDVELTDDPDDGISWGTIRFILYKGDRYHLTVRTDEGDDIFIDTHDVWEDLDEVGIKIRPEAIKVTAITKA